MEFDPSRGWSGERIIEWNHRMVWVGTDRRDLLFPAPAKDRDATHPKSGCSNPHLTFTQPPSEGAGKKLSLFQGPAVPFCTHLQTRCRGEGSWCDMGRVVHG